ncbi:MAG: hypothetical protein F6J93_29225 [Oscillatoria sp. SIO1A7]|nr:hypothetical protein [Oscillatoria sp. SIO1A7]
MQSLPFIERRTLQLVLAEEFSARPISRRFEASDKWEGCLVTSTKQRLSATITDPILVRLLEIGYRSETPCFVIALRK